jgi:hypothetical protein
MVDSQEEVRAAILARYRQLCADHDKAQENVETVQAHQRELMTQINDCFSAARLFGFDLVAEFQGEAKGDPRQSMLRAPDPIVPGLSPVPAAPVVKSGPTIKALVLEVAEKAYPSPVRSSRVHQDLSSRGYILHEKTVGMTLYRWSLPVNGGCTKRKGRDWYFVPPDQRGPTKVNGHRYGPEPVPESIAVQTA